MVRFLLIILVIYVVLLLLRGPRRRTARKPVFKFRFGSGYNQPNPGGNRRRRNKSLDEIEEAEFEDITDLEKEKKGNS